MTRRERLVVVVLVALGLVALAAYAFVAGSWSVETAVDVSDQVEGKA